MQAPLVCTVQSCTLFVTHSLWHNNVHISSALKPVPRNLQLQSAPQSHPRHVSEMISSLGLDTHDLTDLFNDDIMTCSTCKFEFVFFRDPGTRSLQVITDPAWDLLPSLYSLWIAMSGQNPQMACRLWNNDTHSLCVWVQKLRHYLSTSLHDKASDDHGTLS